MSSTVAVARPSQLRQRRESQRPSVARVSTGRANMMEQAAKQDINRYVWTQEDVLAKFKGCRPSLQVHLYANHFRLNDSQESLSYASPMKELLHHIREKTVPHNMLDEFYMADIPFYDNCMIIEVQDHRSGGIETKKESSSVVEGGKIPFSIHNYNSFITPSPFVPYPQKPAAKPSQGDKGPEVKNEKEADKENMPAPGHRASQKGPTKPKVTTVVLFPTPQSLQRDLQLLATTEAPDIQTYRRNQAAGRQAGHPPTPLTTVPPTPTFPTGRSPKRQKMVIDETNAHEFEEDLLRAQCPKLYLEPTKSLMESQALIDAMTHPINKNPPPARKSRKRTVAELAADEAEAADMERFMLAGDDWQANKTAGTAGGEDGQAGVRDPTFQTFSRFKTIEQIKSHHAEESRRRREEEAQQAHAKKQAQELEAKKRKEMEAANRQAEQTREIRQELLRQQQQAQVIQQNQAMQAVTQAQAMAGAGQAQQTPQSATQPQFSSPVVRQQTPMAGASASPLVAAHVSHPMGGTPMVATSSHHGAAGSPARPASALSHATPMGRTMSQQPQPGQPMSRTGTPQMVQGTPVMNSAGPARTMAATPQPRVNQGSPTVSMQGGTPMMMQTPLMQAGQNMTPDQMQQMQAQQMQIRRQQMQQQQGMQASPGQAMNPQQMALMKASAYMQTNGVPQGQNPQQYKTMLAQKFYNQFQQAQQAQQAQQMNMNPQNAGNMPGPQGGAPVGQAGMNVQMNLQHHQQQLHQLKARYNAQRSQLMNQFGAPQNFPQQFQQTMHQMELAIRGKEAELRAIQGNMGFGGAQNPAQMQQYQQALQAQRAQQARQQQIMAMRSQGMNNMGMMNNMTMNNMNMNMGNMGGMQNMPGMNAHNMGMMNMGQTGQMSQQQQQQMQIMMMRQQQQQQQMRQHQQRPQGDGSGMEWSGV